MLTWHSGLLPTPKQKNQQSTTTSSDPDDDSLQSPQEYYRWRLEKGEILSTHGSKNSQFRYLIRYSKSNLITAGTIENVAL